MKSLYKIAVAILTILLILPLSATAQEQDVVTGIVVDKYDSPIPGVLITTKGNNNQQVSAVTGVDGTFSLPAAHKSGRVTAKYAGFGAVSAPLKPEMHIKMKKNDRSYNNYWMLSAQVAFTDVSQMQPAFGLMAGWAKEGGIYIKGVATSHFYKNFSYKQIDYTYDSEMGNSEWWQTSKRDISFATVTGGLIIKLAKPAFIYAGAGYAWKDVLIYPMTGKYDYIYSVEDSYKKFALDAGFIFNVSGFSFTIGTTYVPSFGFTGSFGLGFCL